MTTQNKATQIYVNMQQNNEKNRNTNMFKTIRKDKCPELFSGVVDI